MNKKKIGASLGMAAMVSGLGAGVAASASAAPDPTYHWYKVTVDEDKPNTVHSTLSNALFRSTDPGVMGTETAVHSNGHITLTAYYRATTPFAGGSVTDNGYAYAAWKTVPNMRREIVVNDAQSNPAKGLYTYYYKAWHIDGPNPYKISGNVTNGAHWAY